MTSWIFWMILLYPGIMMGQNNDNESGQMNFPGNPKEVVESDGISIPVYDFEGFKPFLQKSNDTTYIINFWATWCKPCVEEMPGFVRFMNEMQDDKLEMIFVSLDFRSNLQSSVIPFVKDKGLTGHVIMLNDPAANNWIDKVDLDWSGAIPATLIYRNDRKEFIEGSLTYYELKSRIEALKQ